IAAIKDGIVIMKDGSYKMIISVSASNFALKSEEEKNAVIFQFQNFLNSLKFPLEIVVQSRKIDLNLYLDKVLKLASSQSNELIRQQTVEYVDFVKKLINVANIMKKRFFVVITFSPIAVTGSGGILGGIFKKKESSQILQINDESFKKNVDFLEGNCRIVINGLSGMNLSCKKLESAEIINLFYQLYNPDIANQERLSDLDSLVSPQMAKAIINDTPAPEPVAPVAEVPITEEPVAVAPAPIARPNPAPVTTAGVTKIPIVHIENDSPAAPPAPPAQGVAPVQNGTSIPPKEGWFEQSPPAQGAPVQGQPQPAQTPPGVPVQANIGAPQIPANAQPTNQPPQQNSFNGPTGK
ncbi:MAG: hypothetical protein WCO23_03130, partial [bacterium]